MTPAQKIRLTILLQHVMSNPEDYPKGWVFPKEKVDEIYNDTLVEEGLHWDLESEFREGNHKTNIEPEYSRHYESCSVAAQMFDGSWVGWTYWYGGGKHGNPESVEWMEHAYELNPPKEKMVVELEWSKPE